jgi:hypothetical protein
MRSSPTVSALRRAAAGALPLAGHYAAVGALFFLPTERKIAAERWLRGRWEFRRVRATDVVFMSYGKSGRTWLRVMMSRFFQTAYGIPDGQMLEFDNLKRLNPAIPSVFFTHGNYMRNYTGDWDTKKDFYDKRILMLTRDPRDVAVSQYFQWKYRMLPGKKLLNNYPPHGANVSIFDFVMNSGAGLPAVLDFFEIWQRELPRVRESVVVRYEDMRARPHEALKRAVAFLGTPGTDEQIADAVAFASLDNMRRLERGRALGFSGQRLVPGDRANPDSYKVRRAKIGGYRDYFDDEQVAAIDALVRVRPGPLFGYRAEAEPQRSAV